MLPESGKYLWDILRAAELIIEFCAGKKLADYLDDSLLRSAVERQFQIIGDALGQLSRHDPETANSVPELRRIVAFRNILVHGCADVDDELVWGVISTSLPALKDHARRLLKKP